MENETRKVAHRKIFSKHTFKKEKPGRKSTKTWEESISGDGVYFCLYFVLFSKFLHWVYLFYFYNIGKRAWVWQRRTLERNAPPKSLKCRRRRDGRGRIAATATVRSINAWLIDGARLFPLLRQSLWASISLFSWLRKYWNRLIKTFNKMIAAPNCVLVSEWKNGMK